MEDTNSLVRRHLATLRVDAVHVGIEQSFHVVAATCPGSTVSLPSLHCWWASPLSMITTGVFQTDWRVLRPSYGQTAASSGSYVSLPYAAEDDA